MFRPKGSRPSRRVSHKGSNIGNDEHILASKLQKGFSYAEISQLTRASRKQCPTRGVLIHWAVKMTTRAPRASLTHIAIKQTAQNLGKLQRLTPFRKKQTMHKVSPRSSWQAGDDFLASRLEKDFSQL